MVEGGPRSDYHQHSGHVSCKEVALARKVHAQMIESLARALQTHPSCTVQDCWDASRHNTGSRTYLRRRINFEGKQCAQISELDAWI